MTVMEFNFQLDEATCPGTGGGGQETDINAKIKVAETIACDSPSSKMNSSFYLCMSSTTGAVHSDWRGVALLYDQHRCC